MDNARCGISEIKYSKLKINIMKLRNFLTIFLIVLTFIIACQNQESKTPIKKQKSTSNDTIRNTKQNLNKALTKPNEKPNKTPQNTKTKP